LVKSARARNRRLARFRVSARPTKRGGADPPAFACADDLRPRAGARCVAHEQARERRLRMRERGAGPVVVIVLVIVILLAVVVVVAMTGSKVSAPSTIVASGDIQEEVTLVCINKNCPQPGHEEKTTQKKMQEADASFLKMGPYDGINMAAKCSVCGEWSMIDKANILIQKREDKLAEKAKQELPPPGAAPVAPPKKE